MQPLDKERHEPEVCAQVQNLPHPQRHQDDGGAKPKPLDTGVGALVGVSQLLFPGSQVIHLADDLDHHLLHPAQISLDGLELLGGLDGGPVLGVGANVDVELDLLYRLADVFGCWCCLLSAAVLRRASPRGRGQLTSRQHILEADIKGCVRVRREDRPLLAGDLLGPPVLVAHGVYDLSRAQPWLASPPSRRGGGANWQSARLTCVLSDMPSPLLPLTMTVTTTNVSLPTKFRMHLAFFLSELWDFASMSNLSACAQAMKRTRLQMYCSSDRGSAIVMCREGGRGRVVWAFNKNGAP